MSREKFDENCEGCRPVLIGENGPLPVDSPEVQAIRAVFEQQPLEVKKAWHAFTCLNSRQPHDLDQVALFMEAMKTALLKLHPGQ
jgi:hypothetical protein